MGILGTRTGLKMPGGFGDEGISVDAGNIVSRRGYGLFGDSE